jgi:hypothetical protein
MQPLPRRDVLKMRARFKGIAMAQYRASECVLVYLIQQTLDGSGERRLAAKLDCLRAHETPE